MPSQKNGALGATFTVTRILQVVCLTGIIGMTANFISEMISADKTPPRVLVGTLTVTCISVLYCVITYILYLDSILHHLLCLGSDGLLLIGLTVVAVTVGKPLSYMDCMVIGSQTGNVKSTYSFAATMGHNLNKGFGEVNYHSWVGATKTTCLEMKSIWGLSIALCVLFAFSMICSVCLWRRSKVSIQKHVGP